MFLCRNDVERELARPAPFPTDEDSTSESRSNRKRNRRATFQTQSIFGYARKCSENPSSYSVSTTPAVLSSLNPYSYRVM